MEILVSLSALPPSVYRKYRKGWKPNPTLLGIFEKISGKKGHKAMRLYIDAKTDNVIKNIVQNVKAPIEIVDALAEKNIVLVDYIAGTGKDSHGRIVKIGKALAKNAALKKVFDSDPNRKSLVNATRNHQLICLSMHPYDIAGMSTDRGWVSCMNLKDGSNKRYVKQDVAGGTLVAYLIDPQDKNINKPIARCLAKPYFQYAKGKSKQVVGSGVNALYLVDYAYPDATMPFVHTLQDWLNENVNPFIASTESNGKFLLHSKMYADRRDPTFDYDVESPMLRGDVDGFIERLTKKKFDSESENLVISYLDRYPQIATKLMQQKWGALRFFTRCANTMYGEKQFGELRNYLALMFKMFSVDGTLIPKVWENTSGKPDFIQMFIDLMPNDQRTGFLQANLAELDLYSSTAESEKNGTFPAALSEIWQFVKYAKNPENMFWYNASRINNGGIQSSYVDEEYRGMERSFRENVIATSIGALALMNPVCPAANLTGLEQHKDMLHPDYYEFAKLVMTGHKYVYIDERKDVRRLLPERLAEKKLKIKKKEIPLLVRRLDLDMCIAQASEEMYPDAVDLSGTGHVLLVKSPQTVQQILTIVVARALDLAAEEALEEVEDIRERNRK